MPTIHHTYMLFAWKLRTTMMKTLLEWQSQPSLANTRTLRELSRGQGLAVGLNQPTGLMTQSCRLAYMKTQKIRMAFREVALYIFTSLSTPIGRKQNPRRRRKEHQKRKAVEENRFSSLPPRPQCVVGLFCRTPTAEGGGLLIGKERKRLAPFFSLLCFGCARYWAAVRQRPNKFGAALDLHQWSPLAAAATRT